MTSRRRPQPIRPGGKLVRVEGVVYCLVHGHVHNETTDPYDYGWTESPECTRADWRVVSWRTRKGDDPS